MVPDPLKVSARPRGARSYSAAVWPRRKDVLIWLGDVTRGRRKVALGLTEGARVRTAVKVVRTGTEVPYSGVEIAMRGTELPDQLL